MSPVMARCACPEEFPIAECPECLKHAPPALFAPATPPDGGDPFGVVLEEAPPVAVTIAITGGAVAAVVVLGGVSVATWAVGVVIDAFRGRP